MLDILQKQSVIITDMTSALAQEHGDIHYKELRFWSADLLYQTRAYLRDIETFFPWNNADFTKLEGAVSRDFPDLTTDWNEISGFLKLFPSLAELTEVYEAVQVRLVSLKEKIRAKNGQIDLTAFENFANAVKNAATIADNTLAELNEIALKSEQLVEEMDFSFLLDKKRKVFVIGYNVEAEKPDNSFYDLLASESRLASFVAIAKGDAPQEHWFRLGRALTPVDGSRALISWTATMFEYLMPILVMRDYDKTLLAQTYKAVVARQIEYGAKNKVPWGVSEAAYNARDLQFNYQYAPFGIPGLGLKRGLSEDLVVSPYSTALAAQIAPLAALENFQTLTKNGMLARFGFYESVDYTPERLPPDADSAIIKAFMAHHQGMILVALDNLLHDNVMQRRFHSEPLVQATELLLQERIPGGVAANHPRAEEVLSGRVVRQLSGRVTRIFDTPHLPTPRTQILSNGKYSLMMDGGGQRLFNVRRYSGDALVGRCDVRQPRRIYLSARRFQPARSGRAVFNRRGAYRKDTKRRFPKIKSSLRAANSR